MTLKDRQLEILNAVEHEMADIAGGTGHLSSRQIHSVIHVMAKREEALEKRIEALEVKVQLNGKN